jgi:CheY-like chemotaxis protein
MRILIVEDEAAVVDLYVRLLKDIAREIRVATCIAEIREQLKRLPPPDVVILDLVLKGPKGHSDALTTLEEIKAIQAANPDAVVLVISGNTNPEVVKKALELGVDQIVQDKTSVHTKEALCQEILTGFQHHGNTRTQSNNAIRLIEMLTKAIAEESNK